MGIATDILALRNHHLSSVVELLAAIDQVHEAPVEKVSARVFLAGEAANKVLTNVAAHAAEALNEWPPIRKSRQVTSTSRRNIRRFDSGPLPHQRILFA
jgi:hypothetical protein